MSMAALSRALLGCVAGLIPLAPAFGECHFKTPNSVVCGGYYGTRNAAMAYHNYGFDSGLMRAGYTRQLLGESGCAPLPERAASLTVELQKMAHFRVPLPDGYVEVDRLVMGVDKIIIYAATDYIQGTCDRYVPSVSSTGPQTPQASTPDGRDSPALRGH